MHADLGSILSYFSSLHRRGLAFSTLNIHRSVLSKTLPNVENYPVGQHPLVVALLRGCYNTNPPKPRYSSTWNSKRVFTYASQQGFHEFLSLQVLSWKTATLLALAGFFRVEELASVCRTTVELSRDTLHFNLSMPRKSQKSGELESFSFKKFPDPKCCPVVAVRDYMDRTHSKCTEQSMLFVGLHKPPRTASRSTIGRWIKEYLALVGTDVNTFSAHSTRTAAASKAVAVGIPIDAILRAASWSRESTFKRFYHKEATKSPLKTNEIVELLEDSRSEYDKQS